MIKVSLDPAGPAQIDARLEALKGRILAGIRAGMHDAMVGLAVSVAYKLHGNPIHTRTGKLLAAVLASPKVTVIGNEVHGVVSGAQGGKPLGAWLEDGIHEPRVSKPIRFIGRDGGAVYSRGHRQFFEMPKPFLIPSLDESKQRIFDTITARVDEAIAE